MTADHYLTLGLALAGILFQGLTAYLAARIANAYYQGKNEERLRTHGRRLDKAEDKIDKHETRISRVEGSLG